MPLVLHLRASLDGTILRMTGRRALSLGACEPLPITDPSVVGIARAKARIENPKRTDRQLFEAEASAVTGSRFRCLPESVRVQLQLESTSRKDATTSDGKRVLCDYVGPIRVTFENRECYVSAVVRSDEVLLGAVPMEDKDLVVVPSSRRVIVNPQHPNFAGSPAKDFAPE